MKLRLQHLPADLFGLSAVARAALSAGADFGPLPVPRRIEEIPLPAERHDPGERSVLARDLRLPLEALGVPSRVQTSLSVLEREGTFCVVTGQQPGLLAAPLYSLYKALQACRIASDLSGLWGRPVVPIFWNHADDHDVAEVHHAWQLNRNLDLSKVGLAGMSSGRQPLSRLVLSERRHRLSAVRTALEALYEEHAHVDEALELFFPREGETLAGALTRSLSALCGPHGLVVIEPDWIRASLSHSLAQLVARDPAAALERGSAELAALGLVPAIDPASAALVYRVDDEGRHALRTGGDGFRFDEESGSRRAAELSAEIAGDPSGYSPGALLRPVAQDMVFPTCAYVGGYGELAYHAQLGPLRQAAGVPRVSFAPRISITLVDDDTRVSLKRAEVSLEQALRADESELSVDADVPEVASALRATAREAARSITAHKAELTALDPALGANIKRTADQVEGIVEKLAGKAERVHANKLGKGKRHVRRLLGMLRPRGEPQERVLGPLQFTARFGPAWIDALYDELPPLSSEHIAVHLESPGENPGENP